MESYKNYAHAIRTANNSTLKSVTISYADGMEVVQKYVEAKLAEEMKETSLSKNYADTEVKKDKEYLRGKKEKYRDFIKSCVSETGFIIDGVDMSVFIEDMVSELAGYSVLEDAFNDPGVTDIFVISWDKIYVEKNGKNILYHRKFRNEKHYERVLRGFLLEAGKEINSGTSKIVDFELYQDRGAAIHPSVNPKGYSLTLRKHMEDHVTRDQLVSGGVADKKLIDLLGLLVQGETNMICAGITGSGKTTTIRAILDYYVTRSNKRMLVCEDTQELFPKNDHTVEMVSVKSDDAKTAVPLQNLIYTALRLKPKYIVVGEVRGLEAEAAVEGMETGHSTIFTMHGGEPWNIINRLVTKYLTKMPSLGVDVVERIIGSAVDYIFIQDHIPSIGRKITSLHEVSYNFEEKRVQMKPICTFNFLTGEWDWRNKLGKNKVSKMLRRGIPVEALKEWMEERDE